MEESEQQLLINEELERKCFLFPKYLRKLKSVVPGVGALFGLLTGLCDAVELFLGKFLTQFLGPIQVLLYRITIQTPLIIFAVLLLKCKIIPVCNERKYLVSRCISYNSHLICSYISFLYMPYLDSIVINAAMCCIFSLFLAYFILYEKFHIFTIVMMVTILSGVVIICRPNFIFNTELIYSNISSFYTGALWATASGISVAITSFSNRYLQETSAITCSLYITVSGLLMAIIGNFIPLERKFSFDYKIILLTFVSACIGLVATFSWAKALKVGNLMESVLAWQIEIPCGAILQTLIMKTVPTILDIFGIILVVLGVLCVTLQTWILGICRKCKADRSTS